MRLLDTFKMVNPFKLFSDELSTSEVTELILAVNDQLALIAGRPRFAIYNAEVLGHYLVIRFKLEAYKESPYALLWGDTVERGDLYEFIRLSYGPADCEQYLNENLLGVAYDWINNQDIE